jgi:Uma2 family endonuclease
MGEPAPKHSYAEYLEFEAKAEFKHEFIDGLIVAMSGGTIEHSRLATQLAYQVSRGLEGKPCRGFSSDGRVRVEATNRSTYPDFTVVCGKVERASDDRHGIANPTVLFEVLSRDSEADDRGSKFAHYRHLASLQEYVLVSQDAPRVEVFRRSTEGWVLRDYGPGSQAELASIGVRLDVDALYRDRVDEAS